MLIKYTSKSVTQKAKITRKFRKYFEQNENENNKICEMQLKQYLARNL